MSNIRFKKQSSNAIPPLRSHNGWDICISYEEIIPPYSYEMISLGIIVDVPSFHKCIIRPSSHLQHGLLIFEYEIRGKGNSLNVIVNNHTDEDIFLREEQHVVSVSDPIPLFRPIPEDTYI